MSTTPPFFPITTPPKLPSPYGKKGSGSLAARLASRIPENKFSIDEEEFYGEIWMSDHHSNPSLALLPNGKSLPLHELIRSDPVKLLSQPVYDKFHPQLDTGSREDPHLPFVFKVLSFDKALPLQTHPDRSLAGKLHEEEKATKSGEAEEFPDKNYKPEVAVSISEEGFEGFVGFRPISEIQSFIRTIDELRKAILTDPSKNSLIQDFLALPSHLDKDPSSKKLLRLVFSQIIERDDKPIADLCQKLLMRIDEFGVKDVLGPMGEEQRLDNVIRKLLDDYPGDKGMFITAFFMNYVVLKEGDGILVGVDELHAYLKGDIIECMAWGDNMLAHGFQPPEERSPPDTFIKSVSYLPRPSTDLQLSYEPFPTIHKRTRKYNVPLDEFNLLYIKLDENGDKESISGGTLKGPCILLVASGRVEFSTENGGDEKYIMEKGRAIYILPGVGWTMEAIGGCEEESGANMWASYVE